MLNQNLGYLFLAFASTWAGIFVYLLFIQRRLADARQRLSELEEQKAALTEASDRTGSGGFRS
jgi:CcmD family protein